MRRYIKIKASFIFAAWIMIFAHGTVPHNHSDEIVTGHNVHSHHESNDAQEFRELCSDFQACSISGMFFLKFSAEEYLLLPDSEKTAEPVFTTHSQLPGHSDSLPGDIFLFQVHLRAPPVA